MTHLCEECLGDGYIQCPNCDGEGVVEDKEPAPPQDEQLQLPGVDWSEYERPRH